MVIVYSNAFVTPLSLIYMILHKNSKKKVFFLKCGNFSPLQLWRWEVFWVGTFPGENFSVHHIEYRRIGQTLNDSLTSPLQLKL